MTYLTQDQIDVMAQVAFTNYELSCDWNRALSAAVEYSREEWGILPRRSAALLALKLAKLTWQGYSISLAAMREARS